MCIRDSSNTAYPSVTLGNTMSTKKKRIGYLPRDKALRLIEEISEELNISASKVVGILVEESLQRRYGMNICVEKEIESGINNEIDEEHKIDDDIDELISDSGVTYKNKDEVMKERIKVIKNNESDLLAKFKLYLEFKKEFET